MTKKQRRENKNNRLGRFSAIIMLGAILLVTLFSLSFTSAAIPIENIFASYNFSSSLETINAYNLVDGGGTQYYVENATTKTGFEKAGFVDATAKWTIADNNQFDLTDNDFNFTMNVWAKTKVWTFNYYLFNKLTTLTSYFDTDLTIGGIATINSVPLVHTNDEWVMITMTRNSTSSCIWINGTTNNPVCAVRATPGASAGDFNIGGNYDDTSYKGYLDEMTWWNVTLTPGQIEELYNSGVGIVYPFTVLASESVSLDSPVDNAVLSDVGANFTANYTVGVMYNISNATYWIWNTTGVFNNTETVASLNGTSNDTTHYIDSFILGNYNWNVYACWVNATFSNCTWADSNYSFFVGASINSQNYSNHTYETSNELFESNLTLLSGTTFYAAQLNYNGTLYGGTILSEGNDGYIVSTSIDIPLIIDGLSFDWFWQLTYETPSGFIYQNLTTYSQNISTINLSHVDCGTGTNLTLNFSVYNEEDLAQLEDYKFYGTFEYWLGGGNIKKNISVSDTSVPTNFSLCINPNNLTYYSDAQIQHEKDGYIKRSHYLINATLTNNSQNVGLYLLNSSMSTSFIINVIDDVQFAIEDAYVYIQRYYPGSGIFHTVEMAQTDNSGNTVGHFEAETEDYKVIIFKEGEILFESDKAKVFCGETPCTLNFQTEAATPTTWTNVGDLANLIWSLTYDTALKIWTYTYVDTSGTTSYGRLNVYMDSGGSRTIICNESDASNAATLTCNVTGYDGTIYAEAYISRSPEILVWLESVIERGVKAIFGMEGFFWATIILITIGMIGLWSPAIGVVMLIAGMVTINYLQLATFGTTTIMGIIVIGVILLWEMGK